MPSHIFTRLGLWEESIASNVSSLAVAHCYMEEMGIEGHYFEALHAMDYLVYAHLQRGDNAAARKYAASTRDARALYPLNLSATVYPLAAMPTRIALENKDWAAAAALRHPAPSVDWDAFPWHNAVLYYGRALGAAHTGDFEAAAAAVAKLEQLQFVLRAKRPAVDAIQVDQLGIQIKAATGWLVFLRDDREAGLALLQEAAALERHTSKHPMTPGDVLPALELLGDMLLQMNRYPEALAAYEENLAARPNRFNGVYGAALAAQGSGDEATAKRYFELLVALTTATESDRPELAEAVAYLEGAH